MLSTGVRRRVSGGVTIATQSALRNAGDPYGTFATSTAVNRTGKPLPTLLQRRPIYRRPEAAVMQAPNRTDYQTPWAGFEAATRRLDDARAAGAGSSEFWDPMIIFQSTFEILNWPSALDEYVAHNWTPQW